MVQEAWILSILSPNADEQAANQLQSSESMGNTVGKIKTNSSSPYQLHSILPWFALSVSVELAPSTLGFTALPFLQPLQNFQKQLSKSAEKKTTKQNKNPKPKLLLPETH